MKTPKDVTQINFSSLRKILEDLPDIVYAMKELKDLSLQDISYDSGVNVNTINRYMNREQLAHVKTLLLLVSWLERIKDEPALSIKKRIRSTRISDTKSALSSS